MRQALIDNVRFVQAAQAIFPDSSIDLLPLPNFTEIFESLQSSTVLFGVIPFENSSNGSVVQTLDLLADRSSKFADIRVVGEYYLPVHHCLMVRRQPEHPITNPGPSQHQDIAALGAPPGRGLGDRVRRRKRLHALKKIYTHPQAFGQCEAYLSEKLKGVERQEVSSTSKAAEIVASPDEDENSGAIASRLAAQVNDLEVLAADIEDSGDNVTRFFVFARSEVPLGEVQKGVKARRQGHGIRQRIKSKSLISFTIDHALPGALASTLEVFKKHDLNLTSIDTRPSRKRPWHYIFIVECESARNGSETEQDEGKQIQGVLDDLDRIAESRRFWGRWEDQMGLVEQGENAVAATGP